MKKCIINGKIILKDKIVEKNLFIKDGVIVEISNRKPNDEEVIDAKGLYVSPGFIDMHSHGRGGSDTMYPTFDDINTITTNTIKTGVTSLLPTTMTMSIEDTNKALKNVYDNISKVNGCKILGVHMEGPFFCAKYKGAQPEEFMIEPTVENYNKLVGEYGSIVKKMSLAPELEGANDLVKHLVENQVVVSLGHTNATYEEAIEAIKNGATSGTHTYNAMSPLTHRAPGVVGAVMDSDDVYAELILDGIHVSFPAARVLLKTKGLDKLCLITDSIEASGLKDGEYKLGNQPVFVKNKSARLKDGTLAGSILSMNDAVYNAHKNLNITLYQAVNLASYNPAKCLNLHDIGEIAVNKKADICLFDDKIDIKEVYIEGERKF